MKNWQNDKSLEPAFEFPLDILCFEGDQLVDRYFHYFWLWFGSFRILRKYALTVKGRKFKIVPLTLLILFLFFIFKDATAIKIILTCDLIFLYFIFPYFWDPWSTPTSCRSSHSTTPICSSLWSKFKEFY